jgi:hypothetical protein
VIKLQQLESRNWFYYTIYYSIQIAQLGKLGVKYRKMNRTEKIWFIKNHHEINLKKRERWKQREIETNM